MAVITPFFDVVAGVAILAGRSSLLDTGIFKTANTNFTIRHLLALGFIGYGGWNLWKIERAQDKLKKSLGAEGMNTVRCNMCMWEGEEEDLVMVKDEDGFGKGCPKCETDAYLMDLEEYDAEDVAPYAGVFEKMEVTFKIQDADYATFYYTTEIPSGLRRHSDEHIVSYIWGDEYELQDDNWFYLPYDWNGVGEHYLAKVMNKTLKAESFGAEFIKWFEEAEGPDCFICGTPNPKGYFEGVDNICEPCESKWIYDEGGPEGEGYYLISTLNEEQRGFFKMDAESFEAEGGDIFIKTFIEETVNRMDGTRKSRTWISGYFSSYDAALQDAKKEKATYESYRDVTYADLFVRDKGQIIVDADNYKRRLYTKIIYQRYRHLGDNPDVSYRAESFGAEDSQKMEVTFKIQDADYATFYHTTDVPSELRRDEDIVSYVWGDECDPQDDDWFYCPYDWNGVGEHYLAKVMNKTLKAESFGAESMLVQSDGIMVELMGFDGSYRSDGEVKVGYTTAAELGFEPKQLKPVMWVWDDIEGYGAFMATEDIRFV